MVTISSMWFSGKTCCSTAEIIVVSGIRKDDLFVDAVAPNRYHRLMDDSAVNEHLSNKEHVCCLAYNGSMATVRSADQSADGITFSKGLTSQVILEILGMILAGRSLSGGADICGACC